MPSPPPPAPVDLPAREDVLRRLKSPILRRLLSEAPETFLPYLERRRYHVGEKVYGVGDLPDGTWLLAEGEVALSRAATDSDLPGTECRSAGSMFGFDGGQPRGDQEARALTELDTLFVPRRGLLELAATDPAAAATLDQLARLAARRAEVVRALRQAIPFRALSRRRLLALIERMDWRGYRAGEVTLFQGADPTGIFVVLEGELRAYRREGEEDRLLDVYTPGEVFGDLAVSGLGDNREPATVTAVTGSSVAFLAVEAYRAMVANSPAMRRRLGAAALDRVLESASGDPEVVALAGRDELVPGLRALTRLVAASTAARFHDRPLLLVPGGPDREPTLRDGVAELGVEPNVADVLRKVDAYRSRFDTIFLDPMPLAELEAYAPALGRLWHVAKDVHQPIHGELGGVPLRYVALIGDGGLPQGYPSRTTRIAWREAELRDLRADGGLDRLPPARQAGVDRLARAITERTVGLALGGGGAWGFAHVALIRGLTRAGIPVDLVGGSSFGALVAAFYCARGVPGLEQLVRRGGSATLFTQLSFLSSRAFQWWVDRELGQVALQDLEIPMIPVATDVGVGVEYIPRHGTLGWGTRASGAMPPLFTPVLAGSSRIVDGGFINNVPASALRNEGASFVIASNVIATGKAAGYSPGTSPLARFWAGFSPLRRMEDTLRSTLVLFHNAGLREAAFADAVYCPSFAGLEFWNFGSGEETIAKAESDPSFQSSLARIEERWRAFSTSGQGLGA